MIYKLIAGVCDAKVEVARVQFELNMKITELELKAQPLNLPEVREKCNPAVKEGIATVDAAVVDCTTLFE